MYKKHQYMLLALLSLLWISGCKDKQNEAGNPKFIRAKKLNERDKYPEAVAAFNEYLLVNPRSVKTHMFLADLYYDHMEDPLNAIYHYRRVLILDPNTEEKEVIGKYLQNAETKYYKSLEERYADAGDIGVLEEELEEMKVRAKKYYTAAVKLNKMYKAKVKELAVKDTQLKAKDKQLSDFKRMSAASSKRSAVEREPSKGVLPELKQPVRRSTSTSSKREIASKPQVVQPRGPVKTPSTYVIQPGDNLMLISKKVYGTTKHFKKIFQANLRVIPSTSQLKVGQRIVIPKLK